MNLQNILAALNSGEVKIEDVLAGLQTSEALVKAGSGFRSLTNEKPLLFQGRLVKVYELGPKLNGNGEMVEATPRKPRVAKKAGK